MLRFLFHLLPIVFIIIAYSSKTWATYDPEQVKRIWGELKHNLVPENDDVIGGPQPQPESFTVFLTSTTSNGNLGGIDGANQICQDLAQSAGVPGAYKAWLSASSNSTSPSMTFLHDSTTPYVRVDGVQIANNWSDLTDGSLDAEISVDETGHLHTPSNEQVTLFVWSNTTRNGSTASTLSGSGSCNGWTNPNGNIAPFGFYNTTDFGNWTYNISFQSPCDEALYLYCFQQSRAQVKSITTIESDIRRVYTSLALDSGGNPVINYFSKSTELIVVTCDEPSCQSGSSLPTFVVNQPGSPSMVLGPSNNPVVSYTEGPMNESMTLTVATCEDPCISWTISPIDNGRSLFSTSVALSSSSYPVVSYIDDDHNNLELLTCADATCSSGNMIQTVDTGTGSLFYTSLKLEESGNPVIAYIDNRRFLKLAVCGDSTCSSGNMIQTVDTGSFSLPSLAFDGSGNPVISYYDRTNQDLKIAVCSDPKCNTGITISTVDETGNVGPDSSLAIHDDSDIPVISYYDLTNGTLKLAICGDPQCSSGNTVITVDDEVNSGQATSLALTNMTTLSGTALISYYYFDFTSKTNAVKEAVVDYLLVPTP